MTTAQYIQSINQRYLAGNATEHTYRADLQNLIEALVPEVRATNEPKRQSCGAPDYILTKNDIPVGFIEAKDIGDSDLDGKSKSGNKEQFDRYKSSLDNLFFTDYIHFHLYRNGEFVTKIAIGELTDKGIKPLSENFTAFENLLKDFTSHIGQTIKSSKQLAAMMAGKARLLSTIIENALTSDEENHENSTLQDQMLAFKEILIHDITPKGFADVYAQTIAYGMFAARLHDPSISTFSRQEAAELIPKSNPFLRKLFQYIAGYDLDDRIQWVVDDLVQIFLACNVEEMLKSYGKSTQMEDPIIHFYEDFLSEYDPRLRKAHGVWYTPQPVVSFIVRAADEILKTEFGLPMGLADTGKTKIKVDTQTPDKRSPTGYKQIEQEVHKVQILDPATGTGTFLAEVVKHIYKNFEGQQGIWSSYVDVHLLPRLNGFELLMASYAMAHLKMDLLLKETGYKGTSDQRFRIYLTNSLEEHHQDTDTLFANWLSTEANEANRIKRDAPVMVVIGNPPYSVSSSNKGDWIEKLVSDYKKDLNERNIQPLSDDYIKFIRYGQHYIEKTGEGILAYISNNSFIDGIIHRKMREELMSTFDKIYILDLHGNAKKKETAADGSADQNVFDIMQGVSINLFVKTGKKNRNTMGEIKHFDLFGKREEKYDFLNKNSLHSIGWTQLDVQEPNYYFVYKDTAGQAEYEKGFKVDELFLRNNAGLATEFDQLAIRDSKKDAQNLLDDLNNLDSNEIIIKHELKSNKIDKVKNAIHDIKTNKPIVTPIDYRPFDIKYTIYTGISNGIMGRPRSGIMNHMLKENIGLLTCRQQTSFDFQHAFISNTISERCSVSLQTGEVNYIFPLYLYPENDSTLLGNEKPERVPNFNMEIVAKIAQTLHLDFVPEKFPSSGGVPAGRGGSIETAQLMDTTAGRGGSIETAQRIDNTAEYIPRSTRNYMDIPYNPALKERARALRKAGNLSEVLFWNRVKKRQFHGLDFDRQKIIGNYIVDFYCASCNVVVEIDGSSHDNKQEYDTRRDDFLESLGLRVIHIPVEDVMTRLDDVMVELGELIPPRPLGTPPQEGNFAPIDILDYIYAVLHSPTYREKYKEFLKIDFPRVPYPKDKEQFWKLVGLGGELRQIHLLESPKVMQYITQYPKDGSNEVTRKLSQNSPGFVPTENSLGQVWINDEQYFDNVPETAWNFYIGGYQPAQKWLKDRVGRTLSFEEILHYQKIIVALNETDRLMKQIG